MIAAHLAALQAADSSFPAGLYALSYGLEAYVQAGLVGAPSDVEAFVTDLLARHIATTDAIAAAWSWRGCPLDADLRLDAAKIVASQRRASVAAGRRVLDVVDALDPGGSAAAYGALVRAGRAPGHHAVVMAVWCASQGVGLTATIAGELFAVATSVLGAGMRLVRMDHLDSQRTLYKLRPVIAELALAASAAPLTDIGGWTPALDVLAMRHESAERRMFQT